MRAYHSTFFATGESNETVPDFLFDNLSPRRADAPGTIDADYRGEVGVILVNLGSEPYTIARGARIAQMVVAPVTRVAWNETEALPRSARGGDGFGSTGAG